MTTPKKEIIYVDIEDDITAVIEKVKSAQATIVALVPPKRIGMLQSVVNLKLLSRAAEQSKKRLVLITGDTALTSLAAGVSIPVAKNLQSKPEIATVTPAVTEQEEVIDGNELPVGVYTGASAPESADTDDDSPAVKAPAVATPIAAERASRKAPKKGDTKIPNFAAFKKKTALIGGGVALLIGFLVWAIWFAPHATVTIAAKTTPYNVSEEVTARENIDLDVDEQTLPLVVASKKQTNSVEFAATGKKQVGDKATGSVVMEVCSGFSAPDDIPAGTVLTSGGNSYVTGQAASFSQDSIGNGCIVYKSGSVSITASKRGAGSNVSDASFDVEGSSASASGSASGGTNKTETVVSDADVVTAQDELEVPDEEEMRKELEKEFEDEDVVIITESFRVNNGSPAVSPAVGEAASNATLSIETTYQLVAVTKEHLQAIIEADVKEQLEGTKDQKIYKYGVDDVRFSQLNISDGAYRFTLSTTAYAGPDIDTDRLAKDIVGKVEGEIQEEVKTRGGVESVEVRFSPFWVNSVSSEDKITIRFDIENAE